MTRNQRGFTLAEVVVALALLAALTLAISAWISLVATLERDAIPRLREEQAVDALFRLIADDIACRDLPPGPSVTGPGRGGGGVPADRSFEQVSIEPSGALAIVTRGATARGDHRAFTRRYSWDPATQEVVASEDPDGRIRRRTLLPGVGRWQVAFHPRKRLLDVAITTPCGESQREYVVP